MSSSVQGVHVRVRVHLYDLVRVADDDHVMTLVAPDVASDAAADTADTNDDANDGATASLVTTLLATPDTTIGQLKQRFYERQQRRRREQRAQPYQAQPQVHQQQAHEHALDDVDAEAYAPPRMRWIYLTNQAHALPSDATATATPPPPRTLSDLHDDERTLDEFGIRDRSWICIKQRREQQHEEDAGDAESEGEDDVEDHDHDDQDVHDGEDEEAAEEDAEEDNHEELSEEHDFYYLEMMKRARAMQLVDGAAGAAAGAAAASAAAEANK